jgi:putative ABC transport system ATP-binding protein
MSILPVPRSAEAAAGKLPAARAASLTKVYGEGETSVVALDAVDISIERERFTAVMGPSGSGKSTFMHCLAGLDSATSGEVWIGDVDLTRLKDDDLTRLRRDAVGFIFQAYNLVPTLTALENITLPLDIAKRKPERSWLDTVVGTLGLTDRLNHKPSELSGGQQQRVACARALVSKPQLVFGDEPTGNLDSRAGAEVLGFLRHSVDSFGQTIVMVTHDPKAASFADRVIFLADGHVVDDMPDPTADRVLERMGRFEAAGRRT